ncbi:hypothetical protein ACOME3_005138 [Neoechinorhynchus agilis]
MKKIYNYRKFIHHSTTDYFLVFYIHTCRFPVHSSLFPCWQLKLQSSNACFFVSVCIYSKYLFLRLDLTPSMQDLLEFLYSNRFNKNFSLDAFKKARSKTKNQLKKNH